MNIIDLYQVINTLFYLNIVYHCEI